MNWEEVDELRQRQAMLTTRLAVDLVLMGWTLVATDDGLYGARRLQRGDPEEVLWRDGEPEARGHTPEVLLATARALHEFDCAENAKDKEWKCRACGHKHSGAWMGNICVGCPCEKRAAPKAREQRA